MSFLNQLFGIFDALCDMHKVYKVRWTLVDGCMWACVWACMWMHMCACMYVRTQGGGMCDMHQVYKVPICLGNACAHASRTSGMRMRS